MKAYRPESLAQLRQLLPQLEPGTALLAGGTDWIIRAQHRTTQPPALLYLGGIPELHRLERQEDGLFVGACCTMTELERSPLLTGGWKVLSEAAAGVGSTQVRNRATVGGNIANASAAADTAAPFICMGATAEVMRGEQVYFMPVEKLITGPEQTALEPGDVVLGFHLPDYEPGTVSHYYKMGFRREVSISRFGVAMAFKLEQGLVVKASIALGAIGPKAVRMEAMEKAVLNQPLTEETGERLGELLADYIRNTSGRKYKAWASPGVMKDALKLFAQE